VITEMGYVKGETSTDDTIVASVAEEIIKKIN
jgi:hypothetical protein